MFSRIFVRLLFYFDLWGFCTVYPSTFYHKHVTYTIFLVHSGFVLFALIFVINETIVDDTLSTQSHLANDAMKTYFAILTHWIIVIEALYRRTTQRRFWLHIQRILTAMDDNQQMKLRIFKCFYIASALLYIFQIWLFFYTHPIMLKRITYVMIFNTLVQMHLNRIYYYSLHVEIVGMHLEHTIGHLKSLSIGEAAISAFSRTFRQNCELLDDSMEYINMLFGWSIAAAILFSFNLLLTTSNWSIADVPGSPPLTALSKFD